MVVEHQQKVVVKAYQQEGGRQVEAVEREQGGRQVEEVEQQEGGRQVEEVEQHQQKVVVVERQEGVLVEQKVEEVVQQQQKVVVGEQEDEVGGGLEVETIHLLRAVGGRAKQKTNSNIYFRVSLRGCINLHGRKYMKVIQTSNNIRGLVFAQTP